MRLFPLPLTLLAALLCLAAAPAKPAPVLAPVLAPAPAPIPVPAAGVTFTVTGRFEYEDKAWDFSGWTGADPLLPIRSADVLVLDAARNRIIGRGMTDELGEFAVQCRSKLTTVDLLVRVSTQCRTRASAEKRFPRLRVVTPGRAVYSAFNPLIAGHLVGQDIDVGTTTVLKTDVGGKEGNPFNVFDMAIGAFEYVTSPEVGIARRGRSLRITWPNPTGSFSIGRRAYVSTSDGYDDPVILHEIGHLVHNVYSDSDNPGGIHFFGDSDQDLRLAFGEGWATAFAGIVLGRMGLPELYVDSKSSVQVGGAQLRLDLETAVPFDELSTGAGDEIAVACVLYDLLDDSASGSGDGLVADDDTMVDGALVDGLSPTAAWWAVFAGPMRRASGVNVNHVWDVWLKRYEQPEYARLVDVFEDRAMDFWEDAWEPDGTAEQAVPIAPADFGAWSDEHTLYTTGTSQFGPGTGDRDWFSMDLTAGQTIQIETRYPEGASDAGTQADPFVALFDPDGRLVAKDDDSGYRRNALLASVSVTQSGSWTFVVRSRNKRNRYGRYNVRVVLLGN